MFLLHSFFFPFERKKKKKCCLPKCRKEKENECEKGGEFILALSGNRRLQPFILISPLALFSYFFIQQNLFFPDSPRALFRTFACVSISVLGNGVVTDFGFIFGS
eukprot:Hpha_TRINITY_DN16238_c0_g3::TRINITY_DN16238_c0_g3_i1::g.14730::m.14730